MTSLILIVHALHVHIKLVQLFFVNQCTCVCVTSHLNTSRQGETTRVYEACVYIHRPILLCARAIGSVRHILVFKRRWTLLSTSFNVWTLLSTSFNVKFSYSCDWFLRYVLKKHTHRLLTCGVRLLSNTNLPYHGLSTLDSRCYF